MVLNFRTIANNFQEADDEVDYDTNSRDAKSRYVLKELEAGKHRYRNGNKWVCPFCGRILGPKPESMIDHAVGIGRGSRNTNLAISMARHAAYGVCLKKLFARDIRLGVAQPPPKKKVNKDKKARKGRKSCNGR